MLKYHVAKLYKPLLPYHAFGKLNEQSFYYSISHHTLGDAMCIIRAFVCDRFLLNQARQNTLGRYSLAVSQGLSVAVRICCLSLCDFAACQKISQINCMYVFRCL